MKKSVLALALAFGVTTAFAQDLTSKKGEPILPEAGDWGIGIDANPFLGYAKGLIGNFNPGNQTPSWNFLTTNQTISGRYFADEKTVYRGAIRLGFGSQSWNAFSDQSGSTSTPKATVNDKKTLSTNGIGLSGGIEMRKGKTRLQGYYGGELGIYLSGSHEKYTYGNPITSTYQNPASHDFGASTADPSISSTAPAGGARYTDIKAGSTFQFGLRGFIGAEYFILPKMSIGGEFGWGLNFSSTGEGSNTTENWNGVTNGIQTTTTKSGKSSKFGLDTDNMNSVFGPAGTLRFNMYF